MRYLFVPADLLSLILFSFFSMIMTAVVVLAVKRTNYKFKKFLLIFIAYLTIFSGIVLSGLPARFIFPLFPLLFLSVLVGAFALAFSEYGRRLAATFSFSVLMGFQGFRLFLELILHHWATTGTVPDTMTWTGQNFDIISGVISLLVIPFVNKSVKLAWLANTLGFVLLLNVLRVVIMSSPFPFSWALENPIQLIAHFPYALIGPLFVGVALALHLVTFRKLGSLPSQL